MNEDVSEREGDGPLDRWSAEKMEARRWERTRIHLKAYCAQSANFLGNSFSNFI